MSVNKNNTRYTKLCTALLTCLVFIAAPTFVFSQHGDEHGRNQLPLVLNGTVNGYSIVERGDNKFLVRIQGATNPETGKKLNGRYDFAHRCLNVAKVIVVAVIIAKGMAERELRCRVERDPYLYY